MTGGLTPRDDLGHPVQVARPARRVVSLVLSLTESIAATRREALVGDHLVQSSRGPQCSAGSRDQEPDRAAIAGFKPDIVVANQEENAAPTWNVSVWPVCRCG